MFWTGQKSNMRKDDEIRLRHMVEAAREAVSFSGESEALEFKGTTGARREAAGR